MARSAHGLLAATAVLLIVSIPRIADACPVCTGKEPGGGGRIAMLGVMIALPFFILFAVVRVLRRASDELDELETSHEEMDQ